METKIQFEGKQLIFSPNRGFLARLFSPLPKNSIELYGLFTGRAKKVWKHADGSLEKLFLELLKEKSVRKLFSRLGISHKDAEKFLQGYQKLKKSPNVNIDQLPFEAFFLAVKLRGHGITCLMLLGAMLKHLPQDHVVQSMLSNIGLTLENLEICAVWTHELDYEFAPNSRAAKILYCCQQAEALEQHFGYFFELPAIEKAVELSRKQTLKDLEHKKALQILVKAAGLARKENKKWISRSLVEQAI